MRENEMVDISIILVNYKNVGLTEKCIVSLLNSKTEASFEIIVVDNNSGDGSAEILRDKFPHIVIRIVGKTVDSHMETMSVCGWLEENTCCF